MAIGIFRQMLEVGNALLAKLTDVDQKFESLNKHLDCIEEELKIINANLLVLIAEEAPEDVEFFEVRVDKPVSQ